MKSVRIIQYLASDAVRQKEDKYALQQQQQIRATTTTKTSIFRYPKGGKDPLVPVATALNLPSDKTFFLNRNKDLYLFFYPRLSLILCCSFF